MARFKLKQKVSISRVVAKIAGTILALWVGGLVITKIVVAANKTAGPFLAGFKLLGMNTVTNTNHTVIVDGADVYLCGTEGPATVTECLNGTINTAGVLSIVGIVGMASIVLEFVEIKM